MTAIDGPAAPARLIQPPLPIAWIIACFAFGLTAALACYTAAGATLLLPIGCVLFTALLVPPLSLIAARAIDVTFIVAAITLGVAIVWTFTIHGWFASALMLLSFTAALAAAAHALTRLRINPILASAIVTLAALAWLTWPVWGSPWLVGQRVHWLVTLHPLFAINFACRDLGIWTEQRIAYRLTNLGQDVPYELPTSVLPCVALHAGLAIVVSVLASAGNRKRRPRMDTNVHE